jgi:hypothetical protein
MSSSQKTISINPALFQMAGISKTRKKEKKEKKDKTADKGIFKPTTMKNKFIEKIKQHQKKTKKKEEDASGGFKSEFEESLKYLTSLIEKENKTSESKEKKFDVGTSLNKMDAFQDDNYLREQVNVELPTDLKRPETIFNRNSLTPLMDNTNIPYGCLRNGNKPTYRQWTQTKKRPFKKETLNINEPMFANTGENVNSEREDKLKRVKSMFNRTKSDDGKSDVVKSNDGKSKDGKSDISIIPGPSIASTAVSLMAHNDITETLPVVLAPRIPSMAVKKKITRKYICGKNAKTRRVSVIIKDGEGRANIIREKRNLTRRNLTDVKNYLHKSGLLKVGSCAPKKVLMDLYEACILTGKVTNVNDKVQIHNFLNSN